jgi:hypothetical protein
VAQRDASLHTRATAQLATSVMLVRQNYGADCVSVRAVGVRDGRTHAPVVVQRVGCAVVARGCDARVIWVGGFVAACLGEGGEGWRARG